MKINCNKDELYNSISIAQKAVDTKNTLSLLEGILFTAENNSITLISNNMEMGITTKCFASVLEEGSVVIDAKMIGDIIRKLPDEEVYINVSENYDISIESGKAQFRIKGQNPEGFPPLPLVAEGETIAIPQNALRNLIRQTIFSISTDESKKILTGLLLETDDAGLVVVAIDGIRMALRHYDISGINKDFSVVVPGKTMNEIMRILEEDDTPVCIMVKDNQILFEMGDTSVVSRIIEGKYLNYKNLALTDFQTRATVSTKKLSESLERAVLLYSEAKKYSIKIDIENDILAISANTEAGYIKDEIVVDMEGKKMAISFNPRLLYEIVRVIDDETVLLNICTNLGPCTIKPMSGNDFVYTIAAVRSGS